MTQCGTRKSFRGVGLSNVTYLNRFSRKTQVFMMPYTSLDLPKTGRVLYPEKITLWRNDVTVNYRVIGKGGGGGRGEVNELSRDSLLRMAFVAHNTHIAFDVMITLTYPTNYPSDGRAVKKHLNRFMGWARRVSKVKSYFWFMEFQKRGAPHFHIFTIGGDVLKRKKDVSKRWYEIVNSGDGKHLKAGTRVERLRKPDAAGRYAAKYASKPYQKRVPEDYRNVGRWWGHSRDVKPDELASKEISSWAELIAELEGWEYQERLVNKKPMTTLYNAATVILNKMEERK